MLDIQMPAKVKLLAMKTLLSAKLAEGKILIVDNDYIPDKKTKSVVDSLKNFSSNERFLYIAGYSSEEFQVASRNITNINYKIFDQISLIDILKADKIIFNLDGVLNMMMYLHERTVTQFKPKAVKFEGALLKSLNDARNAKKGKKIVEKVNSNSFSLFMIQLSH